MGLHVALKSSERLCRLTVKLIGEVRKHEPVEAACSLAINLARHQFKYEGLPADEYVSMTVEVSPDLELAKPVANEMENRVAVPGNLAHLDRGDSVNEGRRAGPALSCAGPTGVNHMREDTTCEEH